MTTVSFDTRCYRDSRIGSTRPKYAWDRADYEARGVAARGRWQSEFRAAFAAALGGLALWECPPLEPEILEKAAGDGYRRESIAFTTRPGLRAFGHLLVPDGAARPLPAVLCVPGHGVGVDGICGLAEEPYSGAFAVQSVQAGYTTFALEITGFGRRRDNTAREAGPGVSSCMRDSTAALMLGETMSGWRVWDAMRAIDYMETRSDCIHPSRIATMGISGGGLVSLFTAALDTRVAACVVSSYFNTFAASVLSIDHCVDNYVPGLLKLCEMPDLAALVAPRPLFAVTGDADPIFPIAAFTEAFAAASDIYSAFGASEQFASEVFSGGHRFHGEGAFAFLKRHLA